MLAPPAFIPREIAPTFRERLDQFPVVVLSGIRQAGKTTLVRHLLPEWDHVSLEDLDLRGQAAEDPRGFLADHPGPAVIDEAQRVPSLVSWLQGVVDRRGRPGQYVLTGSQSYLLHAQVAQSLAGRAGLLTLLPLSLAEVGPTSAPDLDDHLFRGGFPAVVAQGLPPAVWYSSFCSTYVERDVRQLLAVRDLVRFQTFLKLLASRVGQLVNLASLGADAGLSLPTVRQWLSVLEAGHVVRRVPPWYRSERKRLVKTPKLYFTDTGLLCRLLEIGSAHALASHPLRGAVFECWVLTEVLKAWHHHGQEPALYFWRDTDGHEVDFVLDRGGQLQALEVKAGRTVGPAFWAGLGYLAAHDPTVVGSLVVYGGAHRETRAGRLALPWRELPAMLGAVRGGQ